MKTKNITVCLRNFNVTRVIWFQSKGGGLPKLPGGGSADPNAITEEDEDAFQKENSLGGPVITPVEGGRASIKQRVTGALGGAIDGTVGRVPLVGQSIAHPIRAFKNLIHGVLHPVKSAKNFAGGVRRTFTRRPKL